MLWNAVNSPRTAYLLGPQSGCADNVLEDVEGCCRIPIRTETHATGLQQSHRKSTAAVVTQVFGRLSRESNFQDSSARRQQFGLQRSWNPHCPPNSLRKSQSLHNSHPGNVANYVFAIENSAKTAGNTRFYTSPTGPGVCLRPQIWEVPG